MKPAFLLLGCILLASASAYGQGDVLGNLTSNINIEGLETQFDPETGIATAVGDVHIKYQGVDISAGNAQYNSNTGDVIAKENVVIVKDGGIFRGENMIYNVKTQEIKANNLKSGLSPLFYDASDVKIGGEEANNKIEGTNAYFTTHDSATPNYHVKSKSIIIYPKDRVVMKDVKFYAGSTPVFWLPFYVQPLDNELGYFFRPGFSSQWGAFLLNQYGVMYGDHTLAKYQLDLRSKRGVGVGVDLKSLRFGDSSHFGHIQLYYANDSAPGTGYGGERRNGQAKTDRYRLGLQHRIYLPGPKESTWYLDFDLTKLSDQFMLEDYYLNEFRTNPQPDNTIKLVKHDDRFTATLWTRLQVNNFFHTDERLPELAFDFTRQPILHTGIQYQGDTSFGMYREGNSTDEILSLNNKITRQKANSVNFGQSTVNANGSISPPSPVTALAGTTFVQNNPTILRTSTPQLLSTPDQVSKDLAALEAELSANEYFRAHTYNEFLYPISFGSGNAINVIPRFGLGANYYSGIKGGIKDIGSDTQTILHFGLDVSSKFSRVYDSVENHSLGLHELRHVIEPYLNYSFVDAPPIDGLPAIERITPSAQPRPIDLPLFTSTDGINSWNIARIGVRNVLQTKRDDQTYNWMGLNTFVDVFFQDPEFDRKISNLYNNFYWSPVPWLAFTMDSQLPLGGSDFNFTEVNTGITWLPNKNLSWSLSHQYLSHHPLFVNSSLIYSRLYARINDNWGFAMNQIYEMDDSTLEYQSYSVHRDLSSWSVSLGGLIRKNGPGNPNEYGLVLTFTLKDFPNVSIPLDLDPNPAARGGN
jgi:lipopolysaccharide assembly outer membrane protein LptD (OstA)